MADDIHIQWFPGHMTKTLRLIEKELPNVDMVMELLDARIPFASKNPELARLTQTKPRLLLLNKSDLAQPDATQRWMDVYTAQGYGALAISSKDKKTAARCVQAAKSLMAEKIDARARRGMVGTKLRCMVVGIPNVGKSTFINCMAGGAPTKVEDRPGVTRGKQWISLKEIELLDMPGVLWPKFEDQRTAQLLAFTGAIKDDILDITDIAAALLETLKKHDEPQLRARYKLEGELPQNNYELLELIAKKRGMLLGKGEYDLYRAATMLLDELRAGKLGRVTLEEPPDDGL